MAGAFWTAMDALTSYPMGKLDAGEGQAGAPAVSARAIGYFPLAGALVAVDLLILRQLFVHFVPFQLAFLCDLLLAMFWNWALDSRMLERSWGVQGPSAASLTAVLTAVKWIWLAQLPFKFWWALPLPIVFSRLWLSLAVMNAAAAGPEDASGLGRFRGKGGSRQVEWAVAFTFLPLLLLAAPGVYFGAASVREVYLGLGVCLGGLALFWIFGRAAAVLHRGRSGKGLLTGLFSLECVLMAALAAVLLP